MNYMKKTFLVLTAVTIVLSGCNVNIPDEMVPEAFIEPTQNAKQPGPVAVSDKKRFTSNVDNESRYDDIRSWAEKNKELKSENTHLKKLNDELAADNERLVKRFDSMKANLETAEKELADANQMLIEMTKDLANWKADVLSFREESNYVHKEQLKALVRIMILLGAEDIDSEKK
ncbi:MAG: hypothetical protein K9M75_01230 [Phycisphaerae bacterium]|nr:hypothetical protein [Phycisphaerae bacterium]